MTAKDDLRRIRHREKGCCRKALSLVNQGGVDAAGDDLVGGFYPHSPEQKEYFENKGRKKNKRRGHRRDDRQKDMGEDGDTCHQNQAPDLGY
jgi:hypothetical protein